MSGLSLPKPPTPANSCCRYVFQSSMCMKFSCSMRHETRNEWWIVCVQCARDSIDALRCFEKSAQKRSGNPAPSPTSSSEIATIAARGLAGQPVKCGGERAGLAEADLERNRGDGLLSIPQ